MAELPQVRPDRLVRALQRAGFQIDRTSGSHVILERGDGRFANIPMHSGRDVPRGLLARILKTTGLTAEELRELLYQKRIITFHEVLAVCRSRLTQTLVDDRFRGGPWGT